MPGFYATLVLILFISHSECALYNNLIGLSGQEMLYGNPIYSFASQTPTVSQNLVVSERLGSNLPPPQPPQVLLDFMKPHAPPPAAAPTPNFLDSLFSMMGAGTRGGSHGATPTATSVTSSLHMPMSTSGPQHMPLSAGMKQMVNKFATQLGHKAYYEAHGCVDPASVLHGRQSQMASLAMMLGCQSPQAGEVCELAQVANSGAQGSHTRMVMGMMMPPATKTMLEKCLSFSTLTSALMSGHQTHPTPQTHKAITPPPEAAGSSTSQNAAIDCSGIQQMLMMSPSAAEGPTSPEAIEQIGVLRNRYFKSTCQENILLGSLPLRMCCPGHVRPPTMEEAMMLKSMTAAA
ncbi:hypothetical protein Bpfe_027583 [Biomphalaria pfeifferi]|uniref:Uncharacterized protein n=1 Tax=Biomphalaria pfeifferi TaxID=112525 RepID=A0AAD8AV55_BIOPF|nr:hypothetical protein Bpfe_027583 [Biomphalaria pfeifferi]